MDFTAFSHGQVHSKIWLCEQLEPYITYNSRILILGSWYNVLGSMLLNRKPRHYPCITGIDHDCEAINIANKLCEPWMIAPTPFITNICQDVNIFDSNGYNIIINCSCEHIEKDDWFYKIPKNTLVCLQSSDVCLTGKDWDIKNPNPTFDTFLNKYPLSTYLYKDQMLFNYPDIQYKRFMLIGFV